MSTLVAFTPFSSPSLFIPHEILGEIPSHCDADTLAVASRVSSACLELASPFLYTDIVVKDLETIINLFRLSPSFGAPLPKSDRVTPHTSLFLVYSITVHLEKVPIDFTPLLALRPFPSPLAIAVLVVSMPGPTSSPDSRRYYNFAAFAPLINPCTVIVYVRQPELDSIRFHPRVVDFATHERLGLQRTWDRLDIVLMYGSSIDVDELLDSRHSEVKLESDPPLPPLRMIVDLVSAPERQFARSEQAAYFVSIDRVASIFTVKEVVLRAWVGSEASKTALKEKMKSSEQAWLGPPGSTRANVEVASERLRCFREDLALGARKGMDWAVLEAM